jgi:hypothetical protein
MEGIEYPVCKQDGFISKLIYLTSEQSIRT